MLRSIVAFLVVLAMAWAAADAAARPLSRSFRIGDRDVAFEDITAEVEVSFTAMRWNRARELWQARATVRNGTARPIVGKLLLVITESTGTTGPVDTDNATSAPSEEPRYWNLRPNPEEPPLERGQSTAQRLISLGRRGDEAPTLTTRVYREASRSSALSLGWTRTLDATGHPLADVAVEESGPSGTRDLRTDRGGGFVTLGSVPGDYRWRFVREGYLPVWRRLSLGEGTSPVPFPRLTPEPASWILAAATGSVVDLSDEFSFRIPGTTTPDTRVRVALLDAQAAPYPLPPGWNPQRMFWWTSTSSLPAPIRVRTRPQDSVPSGRDGVLVHFDTELPAWVAVRRVEASGVDRVEFDVDRPGFWAWLVADAAPTAPPPFEP
ncbi:MAG: carboxypeptidase regulatory-like domain-containing protein, partial [Verrucomicrobiales bacterium]|nr:carboxypeptidase regulatory-like domain-containing protein [Verrucomicrobiales bacterium]